MHREYRSAQSSREVGITYHLALRREWDAHKGNATYAPGAYAADGFIHCTNGLDLLTDVANLFYRDSPDEWIILVLAVDRIEADVRYDDDAQTFPHIYGLLNTSAVIGELPVARDNDGTFTGLGMPAGSSSTDPR